MKSKWKLLAIPLLIGLIISLAPLKALAEDAAGDIDLNISASKSSAALGEEVVYNYSITNTSSDNITALSLTTDTFGAISLSKTSLPSGDNVTGTRAYTISLADFPGPVSTIWTFTAKTSDNRTLSKTGNTSVTLIPYTTSISVTKTADKASASPTEVIKYTFVIKNTGDIELTEVLLNDDKLGSIPLSSATLAPTASITTTIDYTVKTTDLPGPLTNIATVTAKAATGNVVKATSSPVTVTLSLNKQLLTKAEILKFNGVPGKGIESAPGLQKFFNENSNAAEHAGMKQKNKHNNGKAKGKEKGTPDDED